MSLKNNLYFTVPVCILWLWLKPLKKKKEKKKVKVKKFNLQMFGPKLVFIPFNEFLCCHLFHLWVLFGECCYFQKTKYKAYLRSLFHFPEIPQVLIFCKVNI